MTTISDERMSKALIYLAETDEPCAILRAEMERAEFKAKATKDALFMRLEGTVAERSAQAGCSDEYANAQGAYFDLLKQFESMRNKRSTESIVIEAWRSVSANRRQAT